MNKKPVELKQKPNKRLIRMIKGMLERAETGELQLLGVFGVTDDGCTFNQFEADPDAVRMLGELRLIERDIIDLCCSIRRKVDWDFVE